jgi:hypothetical protein
MSEDYGDVLEQYDDAYEATQVEERQQYLPDGNHQVQITEARVEKSNWGTLQLVLVFQAVAGPSRGGTIKKYYDLEDERGQGWLKQDLFTLQFDLGKLSALPQMTPMLIGKTAEIKVQRKDVPRDAGVMKTYTNVYINKRIETDSNYIDPPVIEDNDYPF